MKIVSVNPWEVKVLIHKILTFSNSEVTLYLKKRKDWPLYKICSRTTDEYKTPKHLANKKEDNKFQAIFACFLSELKCFVSVSAGQNWRKCHLMVFSYKFLSQVKFIFSFDKLVNYLKNPSCEYWSHSRFRHLFWHHKWYCKIFHVWSKLNHCHRALKMHSQRTMNF